MTRKFLGIWQYQLMHQEVGLLVSTHLGLGETLFRLNKVHLLYFVQPLLSAEAVVLGEVEALLALKCEDRRHNIFPQILSPTCDFGDKIFHCEVP